MPKSVGSVAIVSWPCDAVVERSYEFLDGELPADACTLIRDHLAGCTSCRNAVQADRAFLSCLERRIRIEPAPAELRERIAESLDDEPGLRER